MFFRVYTKVALLSGSTSRDANQPTMLDNLTQRLGRVVKTLRGEARLTDANIQEALREVRMALLEADVALPVVRDFIAIVREKAIGSDVAASLTPGQALVGIVQRELTRLIGGPAAPLDLAVVPPAVILLAGLQGAGKTTSAGKLARLLRQDMRKKVLLVSCDVYRPAAIAQLETLAGQVGVDFFPSSADQDPVGIAVAASTGRAGTITTSCWSTPPGVWPSTTR